MARVISETPTVGRLGFKNSTKIKMVGSQGQRQSQGIVMQVQSQGHRQGQSQGHSKGQSQRHSYEGSGAKGIARVKAKGIAMQVKS
jgi:hypothetical protein